MSDGRLRFTAAALAALAPVALALAAGRPAAADPGRLPPVVVQDLQYGDVLFYYYQGRDLEALQRLQAYAHWNQLPHHAYDAQLLEAGLYLSLGLYEEAGRRFALLLTDKVPQGVRDRAWFHLGQIRYARGDLEGAVQALERIRGTLPAADEGLRVHLLANALVRQAHYDRAIALLTAYSGAPDWLAYARFNLGVALVRAQRLSDADRLLTAVGTLAGGQAELLDLRDRANLALGFAWLQAGQPANAREPLGRVRLDGPYSNKALLGMGWADVALSDYQSALAPWLALRQRSLLDSAVQESWLAVPYAYARLGAGAQAATAYEAALGTFAGEERRLDESIGRIRSGHLIGTLLDGDRSVGPDWYWQLPRLPDVPESRYLYPVLAGHDFQEGLKNFRDLRYLGATLDAWQDSSSAFADMIQTRERADAGRLPAARRLLATGAAGRLRQRRDAMAARLDAVEARRDLLALASPEERRQWTQVTRLESALAQLPPGQDADVARERVRLLRGVLRYRMDAEFKERLWHGRHALLEVDRNLREVQGRWLALQETLHGAPDDTRAFADRLAGLRQRIAGLQVRMAETGRRQGDYLQRLTVVRLQEQKDRLSAYEAQARFALAGLYDKSAQERAP